MTGQRRTRARSGSRAARRPPTREAGDSSWERLAGAETYWSVLAWTMCLYAIPTLLYLLWASTRSKTAEAGCVDSAGAACLPPRTEALVTFVDALPALVGAFVLAIIGAVLLRPLTAAWRPGTVAFASTVMGAGIATLVASIIG